VFLLRRPREPRKGEVKKKKTSPKPTKQFRSLQGRKKNEKFYGGVPRTKKGKGILLFKTQVTQVVEPEPREGGGTQDEA